MISISSPFNPFFDRSGQPLDAGYIYFGAADANPQTSPITVYWDAAGTQPAAQPLRTLNGFIVRNGTPANVFATGDYSTTVLDNRGATVFHSPNADASNTLDLQAQIDALNAGDIAISTSTNYPSASTGARLYGFVTVTEKGGDPTGVLSADTAIAAAIATGKRVVLNGVFKITTPVEPTQAGIVGYGPSVSGLICDTTHAIRIPAAAGFDRRACLLSGFSINSTGATCDDKFAFYVPGVAGGADSAYNSGLTIRDIEIGRSGRMGGGIYLKDIFRVNIEDVGMNDVSRMIQIVGSVVQVKILRVTSNNDSAATTLSRYGVSTETASYSDIGTAGPENVRIIDCSYIRGVRGISHAAGLDVAFENFDTEADEFGAHINAACKITGGVLAPGVDATAWTGIFRGVSPSEPDDGTLIHDVDINCLRAPDTPASSYGIDLGDGVSPVYGVTIKECRIRGLANSLDAAIRGRDLRDATIEDNTIRTSVVRAAGTEVSLTGRRIWCERNRLPSGEISVSDGGEPTAYGSVKQNQCGTVTLSLTTPSQWEIGNNDAVSPYRKVMGVLTGSSTFDPGNLAPGGSTATNVTVTGAVAGDMAVASISTATATNMLINASVVSADTVRVIFYNGDAGAVDLASGTVRVTVIKA